MGKNVEMVIRECAIEQTVGKVTVV
uniref:Uncharacterized protein n=1 Tax=Anguilla anguilla TaxID=7936 RepID=A0A0E9VD02_ANGAN